MQLQFHPYPTQTHTYPSHLSLPSVGDIAATDPLRSSARNDGWKLVANNITAHIHGTPLTKYSPPQYKWGSILGVWDGDGMELFLPSAWLSVVWIPQPCWEWMWPWVQRFLWGGMSAKVDWNAVAVPEHRCEQQKRAWVWTPVLLKVAAFFFFTTLLWRKVN